MDELQSGIFDCMICPIRSTSCKIFKAELYNKPILLLYVQTDIMLVLYLQIERVLGNTVGIEFKFGKLLRRVCIKTSLEWLQYGYAPLPPYHTYI